MLRATLIASLFAAIPLQESAAQMYIENQPNYGVSYFNRPYTYGLPTTPNFTPPRFTPPTFTNPTFTPPRFLTPNNPFFTPPTYGYYGNVIVPNGYYRPRYDGRY